MTSDPRLDQTIRAALSWEAERSADITPPFDQAMRELADRLGPRSSVRSASPRLQRRVVVLLAAALLLTALVIGAMVAGFYRGSVPDAFTRVECNTAGTDCAYRLYIVDGGGERQVYPAPGAPAVHIYHAAWAPGGSQLGFVAGETADAPLGAEAFAVYVIDRDDGSLRRLHPLERDHGSCGLSWAPDASRIGLCVVDWSGSSSFSNSLITIDVATGASSALADRLVLGTIPRWSPDGSWILYQVSDGTPGEPPSSSVWIMRLDGTQRRLVSGLPAMGDLGEMPVVWAADSQAVAFEGRSGDGEAIVEVVRLDGTRTTIIPRRDAANSYQRYVVDLDAIAWSPNGEIAYAASGNGFGELAIMTPDGESRSVVAADTADLAFMAQRLWWSADGRELNWLAHEPAVLGYCVATYRLEDQSIDERCYDKSDSLAAGSGG